MPVPWTPAQLGRLVAGNALGAALVLVGWLQSATAEPVVRTRLTWLAVAIAGLAVAGVVNGLWMASVRARVRAGRELAVAEVARLVAGTAPAPAAGPDVVVAGRGMTRYHRADCELARGKAAKALSRRQRGTTRLQPCEVCLGGAAP